MILSEKELSKFKLEWLEITTLLKNKLPDNKDYALTCTDLSYQSGELLAEFPKYRKRSRKHGYQY